MRKILIAICVGGTVLTGGAVGWAQSPEVSEAVVKVFVTVNRMDFYHPWQSKGSESATGSGCIIEGGRIITNAHVVNDATFIQVRKESNPKKYTAHVEALAHDSDLAILRVDDPEFFEGVDPLTFGELPQLQDQVIVVGFPRGGDKLSITEGVVSRIEIVPYTQSSKKLLAVQIDAAINPGNSGGPVLKDGKIVGIAMQIISRSQNIGYMIPTPIIRHFLEDLQDGGYEGFPSLGIEYHNTENETMRAFYHLDNYEGGVLVTRVLPYSAAEGALQEGDVILSIDDTPIGMDGTFSFQDNQRLSLSYLVHRKQIGDSIRFKVLRQGKEDEVEVKLKEYVELIPHPFYFRKPPYYIYGGLVFTVLSGDLLRSWGGKWWEKAPLDFLYYLIGSGKLNPERKKEIVVLLDVLPDDVNVGYHNYSNEVIRSVNGKKFLSFEEFVRLVEGNRDKVTIFETDQRLKIILPREAVRQITQDILRRNHIPAQASEDVAAWLESKR